MICVRESSALWSSQRVPSLARLPICLRMYWCSSIGLGKSSKEFYWYKRTWGCFLNSSWLNISQQYVYVYTKANGILVWAVSSSSGVIGLWHWWDHNSNTVFTTRSPLNCLKVQRRATRMAENWKISVMRSIWDIWVCLVLRIGNRRGRHCSLHFSENTLMVKIVGVSYQATTDNIWEITASCRNRNLDWMLGISSQWFCIETVCPGIIGWFGLQMI